MEVLSVIMASLDLTKIQMIRSAVISSTLFSVIYSNNTYLNSLLPELEVKLALSFYGVCSLILYIIISQFYNV